MEPRGPAEPRGATAPATCTHCGAPFTPALAGQTLCDACQGLVPQEPRSHLRESDVAGCKLIHQLGVGRFSTSWLAEAPDGAGVVVKLLHAYASDPAVVQRFTTEVQRLSQAPELDHPAVAQLLTGGVQLASALFLVYRSGGDATLADELRSRGRLVASRAIELGAQLAEGLAAIHRAGLLHLDLKPANVALWRDPEGTERAVLLDAATAHLVAHARLEEDAPLPLSTAAYLSPEQARGAAPDARSDLYALGALLFQCISGRLPLPGTTASELVAAHREQAPFTLRDLGRKAHPDLEAALARALAKDPAQRFASGEELAAALRAIVPIADRAAQGDQPQATVDDPLPVAVRPAERRAQILDGEVGRVPLDEGFEAEPPPLLPRKRRAWRVPTAIAAAAVLAGGGIVALARHRKAAAPQPVASAQPSASQPGSGQPGPASASPPAAEPAAGSSDEADAPSRAALRRAQLQLAAGDARGAEKTLQPLLAQPDLPRRDQSHALRLMADSEARRGHRNSAIEWYRKSLHVTDDPAERERVVKIIRRLAH